MTVDVVIPVHPKDMDLLGWCIRGIRRHLNVAKIFVVGNQQLKKEIELMGVIFVDEDTVIDGLTSSSFSGKRWGWYFQQILKLGITDKINTEYYLVVDADIVFLKEITFFNKNGKPLYAVGTEYHKPYFDVFEELFGFKANRKFSFITHHMIFNRYIVEEIKCKLSSFIPWYTNIVKYAEPRPPWFSGSQFSEYETYGHYIKALHPDEVNIRPLRWRYVSILPTELLLKRLAKYYDFCVFPEYSRKKDNTLFQRAWSRLRFEASFLKERWRKKIIYD